ncbi:MAG: hypothetical protein OEW12_05370 [Deltaproteobacteria bacterium]|nr:hypothetical protein [Deltaproteobacteria bacterium]
MNPMGVFRAALVFAALFPALGGVFPATGREPVLPESALPGDGPSVNEAASTLPLPGEADDQLLVWRVRPMAQVKSMLDDLPPPPPVLPPQGAPPRPLAAGGNQQVEDEVWVLRGVREFRVVSDDPQVAAALRFHRLKPRTVAGERAGIPEGGWGLTVILFSSDGRYDMRYKWNSQSITGGRLAERTHHRVTEDIRTEMTLDGAGVRTLVLQTDFQSELWLSLADGVLTLKVIPPSVGGRPRGEQLPYYFGKPLTFLDYDVLAGGYTGTGFMDLWFQDNLALGGAMVLSDGQTAALGRLVVRHQLTRWEYLSIWLEGGGGMYQLPKGDLEKSWVAGGAIHFRAGDWGAALTADYFNGPLWVQALAGWQGFQSFGLFLFYQTVGPLGGSGLGISYDY